MSAAMRPLVKAARPVVNEFSSTTSAVMAFLLHVSCCWDRHRNQHKLDQEKETVKRFR